MSFEQIGGVHVSKFLTNFRYSGVFCRHSADITIDSARTVTLTNHLSSALTITAVSASTGFTVASNTWGASISAGANCTVGVTFSPTATGPATGSLTFTDSAVTSPQLVTLSGTGQ